MLIRQLRYRERNPVYPIETLADGFGDCDCFSTLAASIMMAGGLKVILVLYESHMMIGVHLHDPPTQNRDKYYYWVYGDRRYYAAETTGKYEWRVGELPKSYADAIPWLIDTSNAKWTAPGGVVAKFIRHVKLSAKAENGPFGTILHIEGTVDPSDDAGPPVVYYRRVDDEHWRPLAGRLKYWHRGQFKFMWTGDISGSIWIKAVVPETENFFEEESLPLMTPVWSITTYLPLIAILLCLAVATPAISIYWRRGRATGAPNVTEPLMENISRLKGEFASIEGKIEELSDILLEEKMSEETYKGLRAKYEERARAIKSKMKELEAMISSELEKLDEEERQLKRRVEVLNAKKILGDISESRFDMEMSDINKRLEEIMRRKRLMATSS